MAISKSIRTKRGFGVVRPAFREKSEGVRPSLNNELDGGVRPAPWLPVVRLDKRFEVWITIPAGKILARQDQDYLVIANGGVAQDVDYTANDVDTVLDVNNFPTTEELVSSAVTRSSALEANKPVGWAPQDFFNSADEFKWYNFQLQHGVATVNRYLVEVPLIKTAQDSFVGGDLVKPDASGDPVPFDASSDDVDQVCGRVLQVFTIGTGSSSHDRLDLVRGLKGSGVSSDETSGVPGHLYQDHSGTGNKATKGIRVNITLL